MTTAINVDRIIHFDLTAANASAWQWWTAVSKYNFKERINLFRLIQIPDSIQNIIQSKLLMVVLEINSRYIRPGSVRINCTGADNKTGL